MSKGKRASRKVKSKNAEREKNMEKVTVAKKFEAAIALLKGEPVEIEGFGADEAVEFLEDRAAKAVHKPTARKEKPEVAEFRAAVASFLAEHEGAVFTAKMVGEELGESVQKASAALRKLVELGVAAEAEVEGKNKPKAYVLA